LNLTPDFSKWQSAIVTVGDARGFLVAGDNKHPMVFTAAHCLPRLPPPHPASEESERTYHKLLGRLVDDAPTVSAECIFVDPVADLAVLYRPDDETYVKEADAYDALVSGARSCFRIAPIRDRCHVWLLTLDGRWERCHAELEGRESVTVIGETDGMTAGASGSPIINADGDAVGLVSARTDDHGHPEYGQPYLIRSLNTYVLDAIGYEGSW
jgi:hypothetical protein